MAISPHKQVEKNPKHSQNEERYPFCIVWTPIPLVTQICPTIGHAGICTSDGIIHDFAGSHKINVDNFAHGEPYKYVELDSIGIDPHTWDSSISKADYQFKKKMHKIVFDNCHSYVADALNNMNYQGKSDWNVASIWWLLVSQSKYVSHQHAFKVYLGFVIFVFLIWFLLK